MEKRVFGLLFGLLLLPFALSMNLEVSSVPVQDSFILELNEPAVFELSITNLDDSGDFEIYSLVGVDISPESFVLNSGDERKMKINVVPQESLRQKRELPLNFIYKIKNSKNEISENSLSMRIIGIDSIFSITPENINPGSDKISLLLKNNLNKGFDNVGFKFTSAFFDVEETISFEPKEIKEVDLNFDKKFIGSLNAGKYLMNSKVSLDGKSDNVEAQINFLEQENIESSESNGGFLVRRIDLVKKNVGNVRKTAHYELEKNFISYLFTTYSINPNKIDSEGFKRVYYWEKELIPGDELNLRIETNWFYPFIILILIFLGVYFIRKSIYRNLELRKKVSFVKTKGGEFALKVSVIVKAKNFVERIRVVDKLPQLVKLYDKFGAIRPDSIDLNNRRLEWNLDSLNNGESRIFTYIIYSKIGVVGRFELPNANAVYERDGKVKETSSNRSFYINEPEKL